MFGFQRLLASNSVDIIQPDICSTGGITEAKRIATLASVVGVEIVPHTWGTGIAIAAATHFMFNLDVLPGRMNAADCYLEYDRTENRLREEITKTNLSFNNGELTVSDLPGLGVEMDEEALHKYALKLSNGQLAKLV